MGVFSRNCVLDLSRVLAGPFCGQMLADFGADVIKVEDLAEHTDSILENELGLSVEKIRALRKEGTI